MVQTKKMNEVSLAKLIKELNALGELIRARQDEKQALLNEFDREKARFRGGKISEKALASSVAKSNKELAKLDANIRATIQKANGLSVRIKAFTSAQSPKTFRTSLTGISLPAARKKKAVKKKAVKRTAKKPAKKTTRSLMKKEFARDLTESRKANKRFKKKSVKKKR